VTPTLTLDKRGIPYLCLSDETGQLRAGMMVYDHGPGLLFADTKGKVRSELTMFNDKPRLRFEDEKGNGRVQLSLRSDGPRLSLYGKNKKCRAVLGSTRADNSDGKIVTYPESSLLLFDPNGEVIWQAP